MPFDIAPDDIVRTHAEAEANERPPLLVLEPLLEFLDKNSLGEGEPQISAIGDGHSNATYLFERGGARFVLRRPPRPPIPPSANDMLREARVLTGLHGRAHRPREPLERAGGGDGGADSTLRFEEPENGGWLVRGSGSRLAQVFENLIGNALSFSPPDQSVAVRMRRDGENIVVTVSDHGPGIPENKLETIFERFYTERPAHESYGDHSGLGLSISRQIVTSHGGRVYAENIRGAGGEAAGARFTVILPGA